jgi:hypothetical protein
MRWRFDASLDKAHLMGAYFCLIGVAKPAPSELFAALERLETPEGDFVELYENPSGHYLIMPGQMLHDAEGVARNLSLSLSASCILLHFSDDVAWSYDLFQAGHVLDSYNSRPNQFVKATEDQIVRLMGRPEVICSNWPDVMPEDISLYLSNKELLADGSESKAYGSDRSPEWDAWQLCDFMRKLGLEYPVDENGDSIRGSIKHMTIATVAGLESKAAFAEVLAKFRG